MTDADKAELLDFIAGRGKFRHWGGAAFSFPFGDDNERRFHAACLELQDAGEIERAEEWKEFGEMFAWRVTSPAPSQSPPSA
jgi:hypothetical protein